MNTCAIALVRNIASTAEIPLPWPKPASTIIRSGLQSAAAITASRSVATIAQTSWPMPARISERSMAIRASSSMTRTRTAEVFINFRFAQKRRARQHYIRGAPSDLKNYLNQIFIPMKTAYTLPYFFFSKGMNMSGESLLVILFVGLIAGWLAGQIVRGTGFGVLGDIVVGIIGAFIGGWLLPRLGVHLGAGIVAAIVNATIGAILLLLVVRL